MPDLSQCIFCGFLENGHVAMKPCPGRAEHKFEALSLHTIATVLGKAGGRPKTYHTEEERRAARLQSFAKYNEKRPGRKKAQAKA